MVKREVAKRKHAHLAQLEAEAARLRAELASDVEPPTHHEVGDSPRQLDVPSLEGLSRREALLVAAERVAHLGSWAWDLRNDEVGWSDELFRILGLDPDVVAPSGTSFLAATHADDRERVRSAMQHTLKHGSMAPIEFRVVRPTLEQRQVRMESELIHDAQGHQTHVIGTVLDITEQRRSAQLLARTVAELNEAQRIAGLASWRWDASSSLLHWSVGMFRLLDIPETSTPSDELFYEHVHFDDQARVRAARAELLSGKTSEPIEFRVVQTSGNIRACVQQVVAQWDPSGSLLGIRGVIQDITERKALEEHVRRSQTMEAVGTLAGGVAHDFNNYLMVIAGYTELLSEQLADNHAARESVQAISEAYQRCAHLTQQLLTLSRKRVARSVTFNLAALVSRLSPLMHSLLGETIELRLSLDPEGLWVSADPLQVEQALMNLVVNARDAMPHGGELAVRVEPRREPGNGRELVRLSVVDVGCGIPQELRSRIFEPFFTTKQVGQGTGLGLSTVYAIVRDAGARIAFDSEPGFGTAFHIDWPRCDPPQTTPVAAPVGLDSEQTQGRSILLVEDEGRVRALLAQQLKRAGYRVRTAPHGLAALEQLEKEPCDLVLSDLIMPQVGGLQLAREIAARHPNIRCLLMTGYSPDAVQSGEQDVGEPLLRKPFSTTELVQAVRRALASRRSA